MSYKKIHAVYRKYFDLDFWPCEVCGLPAVDVHHIVYRSQGGQNTVENGIALCRRCHRRAHFQEKPYLTKDYLECVHKKYIDITKSKNYN